MQFNVAGKANARDYIAAGKAGAAAVRNNFIAARKNSPDYGGLGTININTRSAERRAATKAEAEVKKTGLAALAKTEVAQIKGDALVNNAKRKASGRRMAGIVGGLGAIAGGAFMGIEAKREKAALAKKEADEQARWDERMEILKSGVDRPEYQAPTPMELPTFDEWKANPGNYTVDTPDGHTPLPTAPSINTPTEAEAPNTPPVAQQSAPLSSSNSGVQQLAESNARAALFNEVKALAEEVGGAKFPGLVAATAMHETGFMDPKLNSEYNKSGGTNLFGQKGDRGYGTTDRGFTIYPDKKTAVADHIKLWHDTKNHAQNYNAFDSVSQGLDAVLPAYSPNSDPDNVKQGFTEDAYRKNIESILQTYNLN